MAFKADLPPALRAELEALEAAPLGKATEDMPTFRADPDTVRGKFFRPVKRAVSIRLDADVLDHFERQGPGYQTRINEALREYVAQQRGAQGVPGR